MGTLEPPRNILIIKPSALGDVVLALPALSSLRTAFPEAEIAWLVRPEYAAVLERVDALDEVLIFDRKFLGRWWCRPKPAAALWELLGNLRRRRFDLVIDLQGLFRTAFFSWVTGCGRRYGPMTARELAALFYTQRVAPPADSAHVIDHYLQITRAAGAPGDRVEYGLVPSQQDHRAAAALLAEADLVDRPYAVLIVGSAHRVKCWPADRFARLADVIQEQFSMVPVIVGSRQERRDAEQVAAQARTSVVNLAGRTDLGVLMALLDGAGLAVGNDTGPAHIAVALNRPTVLVFGPTNPGRIFPYGHPEAVAAIDAFARGRAINYHAPTYRIDRVSVDMVLGAIRRRLASGGDASPGQQPAGGRSVVRPCEGGSGLTDPGAGLP